MQRQIEASTASGGQGLVRLLRPVITAFISAALVSVFCRALTRDESGVSSLWLVNGFVLALVLTADRSCRYRILAGAWAGIVASGVFLGDPLFLAMPRAVVHVAEIWMAAYGLGRATVGGRDLAQPKVIIRFVGYSVLLASALSMILAMLVAALTGHTMSYQSATNWFLAHSLGMASMAPAAIVLLGPDIRRLLGRDRVVQTLLASVFTIAVAVLVFSQSQFPLLFLIVTPVLIVALRGGFAGVALAVLAIVAVATGFTIAGTGPMARIPGSTLALRVHLLQFFVAWLLLNFFPVVVAVSEHRRAYRSLGRLKDRFRLLADYSSDVIVLTDLTGHRLFVSPSVKDVLGWEPADFLAGTFRDLADPDVVRSVELQLLELAADKGHTTIEIPAHRRDGSPIWIESHVQYFKDKGFVHLDADVLTASSLDRGPEGDEGFVVILRDVSRRREAERALQHANRELASLAWKDVLTGLGNRRRFDDVLIDEWTQALVAGMTMSVIMLDVDHFKAYNDRYGHQRGDDCLTAIGGAIASGTVRSTDIACRYGGEEFAVILPSTPVELAQKVAERIRGAVEALDLPHEASPLGRVTVSVGVACCLPERRGDHRRLISAADEALYACKRGGRNGVAVHASSVSDGTGNVPVAISA